MKCRSCEGSTKPRSFWALRKKPDNFCIEASLAAFRMLAHESVFMKTCASFATLCILAFTSSLCFGADADPAYAPLWLYKGTWELKQSGAKSGTAPDTISNVCNLIGKFFGCQQTVNGKLASMILFIPNDKAGHYYTQSVLPEGWATGRGELEIAGDLWTYHSKDVDNGKTTYYRTTNVFTGKDKIHYEVSESADGEHWTTTKSGDEVRTAN